jgi:hypothetical protein
MGSSFSTLDDPRYQAATCAARRYPLPSAEQRQQRLDALARLRLLSAALVFPPLALPLAPREVVPVAIYARPPSHAQEGRP